MESQKIQTAHQDNKEVLNVYVNEYGSSTLVCPLCNAVKTISAEQYKGWLHNLKVRCNCSHVFRINLDFRRTFRRLTDLHGTYSLFPPASGQGAAHIRDLSLNGANVVITKGSRGLRVGSRGRLDFTLDDKRKTRLIREFVVQHQQANIIGCRFRKDQAFEKELGFYLRFGQ